MDEPRWYYSLHPTVVQFLNENGDVPILAVRQFAAARRAFDAEFELEIVKEGESRPSMEIDFAFISRDGLVIGEAKSVSKLDGTNEKERTSDVGKLIDAARIVGAREICFATTKTWGPLALLAIASAVSASQTRVTVSLLEKFGDFGTNGPQSHSQRRWAVAHQASQAASGLRGPDCRLPDTSGL